MSKNPLVIDNGVTRQLAPPGEQLPSEAVDPSGIDHGSLSGLADDDHGQYHNDSRGDTRYFQKTEHINISTGAPDAGKPIKLDVGGQVDASMINDGDIDHGG